MSAAAPAPARPDPGAELAAIYARVDAVIAAHQPRCELSGRCCDFPTSGHRLYATDLETDYALQRRGGELPAAPSGQCPWFVEGLCRNREGRPLGCRVYFCDPAWEQPMAAVYERFHAELRALHERSGRAYAYRPFVDAVRERSTALGTGAPGDPA